MSTKNKLEPTEMHTFNCASLAGAYQVVSSGGFDFDLVLYKMYNGGTTDITISYDGTTDHDIMPAGASLILDVQANKETDRVAWPAGRELFVKGTAGIGTLYESGYTIKRG